MMTSTAQAEAETLLSILGDPKRYTEVVAQLVERAQAATKAEISARAAIEAESNLKAQNQHDANNLAVAQQAFDDEIMRRGAEFDARDRRLLAAEAEVERLRATLAGKLERLKSLAAE